MALSIGIVGLPNVGKSTLFNSLSKSAHAEAANYPFCTIEPNSAVVPVPDRRIDALCDIVKPQRALNTTVEFTDIAGLVKGASKGEGLGNQFLSHIRETSAIVHVVRCFEDDNVVHVEGSVDPVRDCEVISTELLLADIQTVEKRIERLEKQSRQDKKLQPMLEFTKQILNHLNAGNPAISFDGRNEDIYEQFSKEIKLITDKKVIFAANVDEDSLANGNSYVDALKEYAIKTGNDHVIMVCAKIEEELISMEEDERIEYLESLGVSAESGLDKIIRVGYDTLGLISYFTAGVKEVRAWTIENGWKAPRAASVIHNDFERGFIRAEVISYDDFIEYKGEAGAKAAGKMRTEGKEYRVADGDIMHFLFNI
ncbi:MAG TPA: redox-regulated ATPase YchF [Spirochaetota bacterium]|nr:redox-regulated ATPase YchF [Spirochaetota bacterium]